jgi:Ser/Thr protein kinase RdoA (MazF antagonist)
VNPPADVDTILDAWQLPRPRAIATAEGGYQNTTLFVSCADREFILRVYSNVVDPARQRFEHELLRGLASAELSFAVPHPLPSDDGDTLRVIDGRLAVLFARIPGEPLAKDGARTSAELPPRLRSSTQPSPGCTDSLLARRSSTVTSLAFIHSSTILARP